MCRSRFALQTAGFILALAAPGSLSAATPAPLFHRPAGAEGPSAVIPSTGTLPLRLDDDVVERLLAAGSGTVRIPLSASTHVDVELEPMALLAPGARVVATGAEGTEPIGMEFRAFRGVARDDPQTIVVATFAGTRGCVVVDRAGERFAITAGADGYTLAGPEAFAEPGPRPPCGTPDGIEPPPPGAAAPRLGAQAAQTAARRYYCEMAIDCDYEYFALTHGGDLTAATQYALSLFAAISPIFERDVNVELRVVYLNVWTTPDPYDAPDNQSLFYEFQSEFSIYNPGVTRSLAHLLTGRNVGGYGWTSGTFCSGFGYALSGVEGGFTPRDLYLVPHELGHNFHSDHTHACYWRNAGFLAGTIDSCVVDPCSPGPYSQPPGGGTLMSYCWPVRSEFHQHNRTVMRAAVEISCLVFQSDALQPPTGLRATTLASSVRLTWTPSATAGVNGYEVYRSTSSLDLNPALIGTTADIWWTDPLPPPMAFYKLKAIQGPARSVFSAETRATTCGLEAPIHHPAGNAPSDVTVADFNEDGMLDLAFTDWGTLRIGVMRGTGLDASGRATFGAPAFYPTNAQPVSIAHADFNEDGILDLAVVQESAGRLSILLGLGAAGVGNGLFGPRTDFVVGLGPRDIELADFNEDGILDIAVVQQLGDQVAVLDGRGTAGVGNGTFAPARVFYVADEPRGIAAADFDRDGILDLAVAKQSGLRVLRGGGTGGVGNGSFGFMFQSQAGVLPGCSEVLAADIDGDQLLDLAVLKNTMSSIVIMKGNGAGSFAQTGAHEVGYNPEHMIRMDANSDGILDLVATNAGSFTATVVPGLPGGGFAPGWLLECGTNPGGLAAGDFDGDGYADLVIASEGSDHVSVYPAGCPDLATPVLASAQSAEALGDRVRIVWHVPGSTVDALDVLRREPGEEWATVATLFPDGSGRIVHEDLDVEPGRRYGYALRDQGDPAATPIAAVWVDVPAWTLQLGVRPNPALGAPLQVEFTLPGAARGRLELLDVSGRRIDRIDTQKFGAGRHTVVLAAGRALPPGHYRVRLVCGRETRTATAVVLR